MVVFWQSDRDRQKWIYSGKVAVFGKSGCIRAELLYSHESGCIRAKVVVFVQRFYIREKVVVFGQNGCIRAKWLYSRKSVYI